MTTNETSIVFRKSGGHTHDGATSSLIDTTKYSLFDFIPAVSTTTATARGRVQRNNVNLIKSFIIDTVEERVLNPQGIAIQANTITAREIATGTITANNLSANLILVNNTIQSNNFSLAGNTGWRITSSGDAIFNNATMRGQVIANSGTVGGWTIDSTQLRSANISVSGLILSSFGGVTAFNNSNSSDRYSVVLNQSGIFSTRNRNNTYTQYEILQTQNRHAEFFVNRGVDINYIKQHIIQTTEYISFARKNSESHSLSETIRLFQFPDGASNSYGVFNLYKRDSSSNTLLDNAQDPSFVHLYARTTSGNVLSKVITIETDFSGSEPLGRIRVERRNTSGTLIHFVNIGEGDGSVNASGYLAAPAKYFKITHPLYPDKDLVHAAIEGKTADVFYRGSAQLHGGKTEITLPDFFESLTNDDNTTIYLTPKVNNEFENVATLASSNVVNGKFTVFEVNNTINPNQKFDWIVMATRSDISFETVVDKSLDYRP